ncbi:MAG: pyridoxamine 5'-phosphate oxidase family protein [Micrococcales bacterium]|nr:pyridoxamine 5'-phosphate oxidase family protein [Micrococcales bacterium]
MFNDDPELAELVRAAFAVGKHCTMATLRADGAPRISGTEVEFTDDGIFFGTAADARKTLDLRRDPRVAVHSPTRDPGPDGAWAGEAKLSGVAVEVPAPPDYPPHAVRFRIDLTSAVHTGLTDEKPPRLRIRLWRPGRVTQTMYRA